MVVGVVLSQTNAPSRQTTTTASLVTEETAAPTRSIRSRLRDRQRKMRRQRVRVGRRQRVNVTTTTTTTTPAGPTTTHMDGESWRSLWHLWMCECVCVVLCCATWQLCVCVVLYCATWQLCVCVVMRSCIKKCVVDSNSKPIKTNDIGSGAKAAKHL